MFMKRLCFLVITIFFFITSFGQRTNYKKANVLGFSFFLNDFQTASDIRNNGLVSVVKAGTFFKTQRMNPGLAINYISGLSDHVDFTATVGGSFLRYPINNKPDFNSDNFLLETTASLNLKLLTDRYPVVPFIDLGIGASNYKKYFSAFIPVGL